MATGPRGIFVPLVWRRIGVQWVQLETGVAPTPSPMLKPLFPENTFILVLFLESKENQMLSGNLRTQRSRAPNYREDLVICHIKGGQGEERVSWLESARERAPTAQNMPGLRGRVPARVSSSRCWAAVPGPRVVPTTRPWRPALWEQTAPTLWRGHAQELPQENGNLD